MVPECAYAIHVPRGTFWLNKILQSHVLLWSNFVNKTVKVGKRDRDREREGDLQVGKEKTEREIIVWNVEENFWALTDMI